MTAFARPAVEAGERLVKLLVGIPLAHSDVRLGRLVESGRRPSERPADAAENELRPALVGLDQPTLGRHNRCVPKDHYLPAALIARFSPDGSDVPVRRKRVACARLGWRSSRMMAAESIGYVNNLYSIDDDRTTDEAWRYEGALPGFLNLLAGGHAISLSAWLRIGVPFVASIFVRGREFDERFKNRFSDAWKGSEHIQPNGARSIELQRLMAPVTAARWVVLHNGSSQAILNSDLGAVFMGDSETREVGWGIPIDSQTILGVLPKDRRAIGRLRDDRWEAVIEHKWGANLNVVDLNDRIASSATEFVFGRDGTEIDARVGHLGQRTQSADTFLPWPYSSTDLRQFELEWHRISSIITPETSTAVDVDGEIDFEELKTYWASRLWLTPQEVGHRRVFRRAGRTIVVALHDPPRDLRQTDPELRGRD